MNTLKKFLTAVVISTFAFQIWAQEPPKEVYKLSSIVLYEADQQFGERAGDPQTLSVYIRNLVATANTFFAKETVPSTFQIIVAVRPGNISHIWFISSQRDAGLSSSESELTDLQKMLQAVKPVSVSGLICFDIIGTIAGGDGKIPDPKASLPLPQAWKDLIKAQDKPIIIDDLINSAWPSPKEH